MGHDERKANVPGERLPRALGVGGATMLGLGSILGTGVFVSLGLAAGLAGHGVVVAVGLAAALAACNAMSSAQLAAAHPVSGGTYEYGYRLLHPALGFTAGWLFLLAKSASAATAALGLAGYALTAIGLEPTGWLGRVPAALAAVVALTGLVLGGMKRSSAVNTAVVSITLLALVSFIVAGGVALMGATGPINGDDAASTDQGFALTGLLQATALTFVAYTGYGRIATLGEEVRAPTRTIPAAVVTTVLISALLYAGVAAVGVMSVGPSAFDRATTGQTAPLAVIARSFSGAGAGPDLLVTLITAGAVTAMLGVLLNLLLGLSRVLLAMARRGDMPGGLARLNRAGTTPREAVVVTGLIIAAIVCVGRVELTWSFSALTVLIYYGLTNLAALRLPADARRYPRGFAWAGLIGCLALTVFIEPVYWAIGGALILFGLLWHRIARKRVHVST